MQMSEALVSAIGSREVLRLSVNGQDRALLVKPYTTLMEVLREDLRLTGTKHGCEAGECGACTVLIDGVPKVSCLVLTAKALLDTNPAPSEGEIKQALAGNLCRCTGYVSIVEAVQEAGRALA